MDAINKLLNFLHVLRDDIQEQARYVFSFLHIKIFLIILSLVNAAIWGAAFYIDKKIADQRIALHYNVDFGVDYYGDISNIYIIPFLGLFFIFFNTLLLGIIKKHKDFNFLSYLLLSLSLLANLILIAAIISIFLVNY
jgi:hypothetical protein